jgi:phosphohistidine phosphatase
MHLLVIRHGLAGDREEFAKTGRPDDERPLTPKGRRRMRRNARGLRTLVPGLDLLATMWNGLMTRRACRITGQSRAAASA